MSYATGFMLVIDMLQVMLGQYNDNFRGVATGEDKRGIGVQGQSPGVVWGRNPQKPETNANFQLRRRGHSPMYPLGYATQFYPLIYTVSQKIKQRVCHQFTKY